MAFSSKGRTQTALAEINITPLVDVVLRSEEHTSELQSP